MLHCSSTEATPPISCLIYKYLACIHLFAFIDEVKIHKTVDLIFIWYFYSATYHSIDIHCSITSASIVDGLTSIALIYRPFGTQKLNCSSQKSPYTFLNVSPMNCTLHSLLKTLLLCLMICSCSIYTEAQDLRSAPKSVDLKTGIEHECSGFQEKSIQAVSGNEVSVAHHLIPPLYTGYGKRSSGTVIGETTYDLQSNYSMCRRVLADEEGNVYTAWNRSMSFDLAAPDRGTGFNWSADGGDTWNVPLDDMERLEDDIRSGWPNIGKTESGRLYSISHTNVNGMNFCYSDDEGANWNNMAVGIAVTDEEGLWPRAAVDGDHIYAINSRMNGEGSGIEGSIKFIRSLDGGESWESSDIAGFNEYMGDGCADCYQIDARDGVVAIAYGTALSPVLLAKSYDEGETWTFTYAQTTENPLQDSDIFFGAVGEEEVVPWSPKSGGGVQLVLDSDGNAHLVWDFLVSRQLLVDVADDTFNPYPDPSALAYWTEGMDNPSIIGKSVRQDYDGDGSTALYYDADGDGINDFENAEYGFTYVGQPSLGIDQDDNLYCAYSANIDGAYESDVRVFRDVYLIKLDASTNEWKGPLNISENPEREDVFPTIQRYIYDKVHFIWQSDLLTGINALAGQEFCVLNEILYESIDVEDINDPLSPVNTAPEIFLVDGIIPYALLNCPPNIDRFGQLYIFDYPDGDISDLAEASGTDVSVVNESEDPAENSNYWDLSATDVDGNSTTYAYKDTDGNYYPILVFDDLNPPIILLEPVNVILSDEDGDGIEEEYVFEQIGFDTIDVLIDTEYTDYGAWLGGDEGFVYGCQPELSVSSTVNTAIPGTYTVTYEAVDINGNEAVTRTRVVNVISEDPYAPVLEIYDLIDDELITVEEGYEFIVGVGTDSWNIPGYYAYDNVEGNLTADVVIEGTFDLSTIGIYTLTFSITDTAGNTTSQTVYVIVSDLEAPEIELVGSTYVALPCNQEFMPWGYTAFDEVDGDLTSAVSVSVQIEYEGEIYDVYEPCPFCEATYIITYEVCDAAGNCTTETRTVEVFDVLGTGECIWDCSICYPGGIDESYLDQIIKVYPSPTTGILKIELDPTLIESVVKIYNVTGRLIAQQVGQGTITADLTAASAGVYLVKIVTAEGTITKKVVLDK